VERLTTPFERQVDMIKFAVSRLQRTTTWDMTPVRKEAAQQYLDDLHFLVMDAKAAL
jgi:hypothetical protein